jgi:P4 family phage/plasmid primase-like protien
MSKPIEDTIIQEALADRASAQQTDQDDVATQIEASNSLPAIPVNSAELSPRESLIQLAQKMGWRLIRVIGKSPIDKGWPTSSGLTEAEAMRHPGNLGIVCGEPSGRLFIVDIDGERPANLPETPTVITGSGGQHLYYHLPEGIELTKANKVSHVATKVDIRWTGGQVVAPGSIHPETGGLYDWMPGMSPDDVPMVDVPQWVLDGLNTPKEDPKPARKKKPTKKPAPKLPNRARTGSPLLSSPQYRSSMLKAAAEEMRNAPVGKRNDILNAKAYALAGFLELSEDEITDTLLEAARDAGLNDFEACGTIKSGFDAGRKAPHTTALETHQGQLETTERALFDTVEEFQACCCTDVANGERFQSRYAGHAIHSDSLGWLVWDGRRFARDSKAAREFAKVISDDIRAEITVMANTFDMRDPKSAVMFQQYVDALNKWSKLSASTRGLDNILTEAKTTPGINGNALEFDVDPWLLNCLNGTIDLRTGELMSHNPDHLITKLTPIEYDPEALCPRWDQFLLEVFEGDEDVIEYVKRALAYSMTGDTSWQAWFLLHGRGENGKSRFVDVLRHVIGADYCHEIDPEELCQQQWSKHTTERAALMGVRYLTSEETDEGRQLAEAFVKALTGGGKLRARFMRQDSFEFEPICKLWLSTNNKPIVKDSSHGFWRRVRLIPFNACFANSPTRDPNLSQKLAAEAPGILAQLVRYSLVAYRDGEGAIPTCIQAARDAYREDSDLLGQFLEDHTTADASHAILLKRELYETYKHATGGKCETSHRFNSRVKGRGIADTHTRDGAAWVGLSLIPRI